MSVAEELDVIQSSMEVRNRNVFLSNCLSPSSALTFECDCSLNLIPESTASPPGLRLSRLP